MIVYVLTLFMIVNVLTVFMIVTVVTSVYDCVYCDECSSLCMF